MTEVPVDALRVVHSYRMTDEVDQDLVASIREVGVLVPLVVMPNGDGYVVLDGRRRLAAARLAGLARVPVVILRPDHGERMVEAVANLHRRGFALPELATIGVDLVAMRLGLTHDDARTALWRLHGRANTTEAAAQDPVGEALLWALRVIGVSYSYWFGHVLPSLGWPEEVQEAARRGILTVRAARASAAIRNPELRKAAIAAAAEARQRGIPPERAVRKVIREAHVARAVAQMGDALEVSALPRGWRAPTGSMRLEDGVYDGETVATPRPRVVQVPRLWEAYGLAYASLVGAYLLAATTAPGHRVLLLWGGAGEIGDIAAATGRATYWVEPLGLRHEQIPASPDEAELPEADVALVLPPMPGARVGQTYGVVPEAGRDLSAQSERMWGERVARAVERARAAATRVYLALPGPAWHLAAVRPVLVLHSRDGEVLLGEV